MEGKPSILFITVDEMRKDSLSCYGGRAISTPNLDRLAAGSLQFDRAYSASPWCLPSRCSMLTGLLPHESGAYSNFRKRELGSSVPNFFRTLKSHGYRTALAGKCHFAPVPYSETRADRTLPYDEFRSYYVGLGIDDLYLQDDKQVSVWFYDDYARELDAAGHLAAYREKVWDRSRSKVFPFPAPDEWHPDVWVGRKAREHIRNITPDTPTCLWVSFSGPHYTFDAPESYYARVDQQAVAVEPLGTAPGELDDPGRIHHYSYYGQSGKDGTATGTHPGIDGSSAAPGKACRNYDADYWRRLRTAYYANVALLDDQIGEVLSAARETFGDDLLIIFTADHGEMLGHHGLWGKNNCAYEDVWNVPLIVRYPGSRFAHELVPEMVSLQGIAATIYSAAGIDAEAATRFSGSRDLRSLAAKGGLSHVVAEGEGFAAIFDGRHKLVRVRQQTGAFLELFDLEVDPGETRNLAGDERYRAVRLELTSALADIFMDHALP